MNWMSWGGGDDYAYGRCGAVLTDGRQHRVRPSDLYRDRGFPPWVQCVQCKQVLWGFYMITEEEDPITLM